LFWHGECGILHQAQRFARYVSNGHLGEPFSGRIIINRFRPSRQPEDTDETQVLSAAIADAVTVTGG
jgi:hypothetical protein